MTSILLGDGVGDGVDVDYHQLNEQQRGEAVVVVVAAKEKLLKLQQHLLGNVEEAVQVSREAVLNRQN